MGLGGHMMWTAIAREIVEHYRWEHGEFKVLPVSNNTIVKSDIFKNNPYFTDNREKPFFAIDLSHPVTNYCIKEENRRAYHKYDKHIIELGCEYYGIKNPELKCNLYFTEAEKNKVDEIFDVKKKFIAIEPHSKIDYTANNAYPFEKWQNIVNHFKSEIQFVQIGVGGKKVLDSVIDFTGRFSYRETCYIIQKAICFLGTIGGLMHGANAVDTKSIIIVTPYQHPNMACYPENINIRIGGDEEFSRYSGILGYNKELDMVIKNHNEEDVVKEIKDFLNKYEETNS